MDSLTHVELAKAFLQMTGRPSHLAVASLFPQVDRKPATLHRLYAHTVFKAKTLTSLGLRILFGGAVSAEEQRTYAYARFREEGPRLWGYLSPYVGDSPFPRRTADVDAGVLAFVSHLYLDTFNQPVQPFAPVSVDCAGQWMLWKRLGDFRLELYTTDAIHRLRSDLFAHALWGSAGSFTTPALTQAMLLRLDDLSAPRVRGDVTAQALAAVEMKPEGATEVRAAVDFLVNLEDVLGGLHEKHIVGTVSGKASGQKTVAVA